MSYSLVDSFVSLEPNYEMPETTTNNGKFLTSISTVLASDKLNENHNYLSTIMYNTPISLQIKNEEVKLLLSCEKSNFYIEEIGISKSVKDPNQYETILKFYNIYTSEENILWTRKVKIPEAKDSESTFEAVTKVVAIEICKTEEDSLDDSLKKLKKGLNSRLESYKIVDINLYNGKEKKQIFLAYKTKQFFQNTLKSITVSKLYSPSIKKIIPTTTLNKSYDRYIQEVNNFIVLFLTPSNLKFKTEEKDSSYKFYTNFLTDQSGQESYISTLIFYKKSKNPKTQEKGFSQRSYSIISRIPAYKLFAEILLHIHTTPHINVESLLFPLILTNIYTKHSLIISLPEIKQIQNTNNTERKFLYQKAESDSKMILDSEVSFPFIGTIDFSLLFVHISLENITKLLTLILLEESLIITSFNTTLLTPIIEQLRTLIYPFEWQFTVIPVMKTELRDVLEAPMPLLVGMKASEKMPYNRVCFNIETGMFSYTNSQNNFERRRTSDIKVRKNLFSPFLVELAEDLRFGGLFYDLTTLELDEIENFSDTGCRIAFLRLFINLVSPHFLDFLIFPNRTSEESKSSEHFGLQELLKVPSYTSYNQKTVKKFYDDRTWFSTFDRFIKTDCFYRFIYNTSFIGNSPLYFFTETNHTNLFKTCCFEEMKSKRGFVKDLMNQELGFLTIELYSFKEEMKSIRMSFPEKYANNIENFLLNLSEQKVSNLKKFYTLKFNRTTKFLVFSTNSRNAMAQVLKSNSKEQELKSKQTLLLQKETKDVEFYGSVYNENYHGARNETIESLLKYYKGEFEFLKSNLPVSSVEHCIKFRRDLTSVILVMWVTTANFSSSIRYFNSKSNFTLFDNFFNEFMSSFERLKILPSKVLLELLLLIVNEINNSFYISKICNIMKQYSIPINKNFYKKNLSITRLSKSNFDILKIKNIQKLTQEKETSKTIIVGSDCGKCGYYNNLKRLISSFTSEFFAVIKCPNCGEDFVPYFEVHDAGDNEQKKEKLVLFPPVMLLHAILEELNIKVRIEEIIKNVYSTDENNLFKKTKSKISNSKSSIKSNDQLLYNIIIYFDLLKLPMKFLTRARIEIKEKKVKHDFEESDLSDEKNEGKIIQIQKALSYDNLEGALMLDLSMRKVNLGKETIFNKSISKVFISLFKKCKTDKNIEKFREELNKKMREVPDYFKEYINCDDYDDQTFYNFLTNYFSSL